MLSGRASLAGAGALGFSAGLAYRAKLLGPQGRDDSPPLCGTYELSALMSCRHAAVGEEDLNIDTGASGLLRYDSSGCVSTHLTLHGNYVGYSGRWWIHDAPSLFPPHGRNLVEHHVKAASQPSLVGQTLSQQWALSEDGQQLTIKCVSILFGEPKVTEVAEWKRVGL